MDSVRSHSPGQRLALAFAARPGVAALAALVMACSSTSSPVGSDAGTDSGAAPPRPDAGSDAPADAASEAASCTPITALCDSFTVCCAGGTCVPTGQGDSLCTG